MIFTCFCLHRIVLGCIFHATFKSLLDVIAWMSLSAVLIFFCTHSTAFLWPWKIKRTGTSSPCPHLDLLVYLILRHELTSRAASKISKSHPNFGEHVRRHCFPTKWPPRERGEHFLLLCDRQESRRQSLEPIRLGMRGSHVSTNQKR